MSEIKTPKSFSFHKSISSVDGRFRGKVEEVAEYFSEFATSKYRVLVEIEYLIEFLATINKDLSGENKSELRKIYKDFSLEDQELIWQKDEIINHDTKAVEYFLQGKLASLELSDLSNYIHFGLTSSDIDYTAIALQLRDFNKTVLVRDLKVLIDELASFSEKNREVIMLARTHGQPAVPTSAGKEIANFVYRLRHQQKRLNQFKFESKLNGAVGNYNALLISYPEVDWASFSISFLKKLGLKQIPYTTQIPPLDYIVEYLDIVRLINSILIDFNRDMWGYLALGYMVLEGDKAHVGSSTMPQKINPIGFELAESYCELANGLIDVMQRRLPVNRWQRDLTDKYIIRELGQIASMSYLAYRSIAESVGLVAFNKTRLENDLDSHWEVIAEGLQTLLRTTGTELPYEKIKDLTRGVNFTKSTYLKFVEELEVNSFMKAKLKRLSPLNYIGQATVFPKP